ncbi:MAG: hypothetical protein AAF941_03340 [Pseudomonadota bacterium]
MSVGRYSSAPSCLTEIAAANIVGYLGSEPGDRRTPDGDTVFNTILRFADEAAIDGFVGEDRTRANLPEAALELLYERNTQALHYAISQPSK